MTAEVSGPFQIEAKPLTIDVAASHPAATSEPARAGMEDAF